MEDYQKITERLLQLDIFEVARKLGIPVNSRNKTLCIMHKERNPSMHFNKKKNNFYCYGCSKGGSVIDLVMISKNCDFKDAVEWLKSQFGIYDSTTLVKNTKKKVVAAAPSSCIFSHVTTEETYIPDIQLLNWIIDTAPLSPEAAHFLFEERCYSPEVVERCKVKSITYKAKFLDAIIQHFGLQRCLRSGIVLYDTKFKCPDLLFPCPCIIFPYYDENGSIFTIQARSLDVNRSYCFPKGSPSFIFNLCSALEVDSETPLYIAEGPTDCLAFLSEGKQAIGIPGACAFRKKYVHYLCDKSLFMYTDNDSAGDSLYQKAEMMLNEKGNSIVRNRLDSKYKDYSDLHADIYKEKK